jgi:hypothetical protein
VRRSAHAIAQSRRLRETRIRFAVHAERKSLLRNCTTLAFPIIYASDRSTDALSMMGDDLLSIGSCCCDG